jgi:hypothetical protein
MAKRKRDDRQKEMEALASVAYAHDEDAIAQSLGLQRNFVRQARESVGRRHPDAYQVRGGAVLWRRDALNMLLREVGLIHDDIWADKLAEASHVGPDWERGREGCERLLVTGIPTNRTLVLAREIGKPEPMTMRVYVGANDNFVTGMELCARLLEPPDLYELVGARPRGRGVW